MRTAFVSLVVLVAILRASAAPAVAQTTLCRLTYALAGWSTHFNESAGTGTIVCDNGQRATVSVAAHSPKLPSGTGAVTDGRATFSPVLDISALIGSYALPPAARAAGGSLAGAAGTLTNGQATLTFPLSGPGSSIPATFERVAILARAAGSGG